MDKVLQDFEPQYSCRSHPTEWFHEVGCPHQQWAVEQLQDALNAAKQSNAYLIDRLKEKEFEDEEAHITLQKVIEALRKMTAEREKFMKERQ